MKIHRGLAALMVALVAAGCQAQATGTITQPSPQTSASPPPAANLQANEGDRAFIDGMVPHHEMAVSMAQDALAKSDRQEIKTFAQGVIDDQSKEIAELKGFRQQWFGSSATPMMDHAQMKMFPDGPEFDKQWSEEMIMHHQMAIEMAQRALTAAARPETKTVAQRVIDVQKKEQDQLRAWIKAWYGQ